MKTLLFLALLITSNAFSQSTSAPVNAELYDAAGNPITSTSGAVDVNVKNSGITQPVSGSVSVSNLPATQPVSGTFWQSTQPVSGSLGRTWSLLNTTDSVNAVQSGSWSVGRTWSLSNGTDSIAVTGTFWQDTQPVSIASLPSVAVSNFPVTQPVSGTFWQATQPVSAASLPLPSGAATSALQSSGNSVLTSIFNGFSQGTALVNNLPGSTTPDTEFAGSITSGAGSTSYVSIDTIGYSSVLFNVTGTWAATLILQGSYDLGTTWIGANYKSLAGAGVFSAVGNNSAGLVSVGGFTNVRVVATSYTSGTATVTMNAGVGQKYHAVYSDVAADLLATVTQGPGGSSAWKVDGSAVTQPVSIATMPSTPVTGTFWQSTQPVSLASLPSLAAGSAVIGHVIVDTAPSTAVTNAGTFAVQATQAAGGNPCQSPQATLVSATGATSGTSAVQIVALSGSTKIYICSLSVIGVSGTSPTFSLVQGTGTNCATSQTTVVQSFASTAGQLFNFATPVSVGVAGNALCYKDGGTSPIQNYQINYVQQ